MLFKIILFNFIVCITFQSTASAQQDTPEKFVVVGNLRFRDFDKNGKLDVYEDYRKPNEQRAQDLLSRMTLQEKLAQLKCPYAEKEKLYKDNRFNPHFASEMFPDGLGEIHRVSEGAILWSNPLEKTPAPKDIVILANESQHYFINKTRLGIPVLFLEEGLHGLVVRDGTAFPSTLGMSCSWNEDLMKEVYEVVAQEARAIGTHNILGPVLDLALDPRWGRTEETMGEDPYLVSRLGVSIVKALQGNSENPNQNHVASTLKHLGAHGQPEGGSNTGPVFISERQLREVNFKPFKAAITEGKALGIMPNYNEISGIPSHADKWLLSDVLRNEWNFKGVVVSDYTATEELNHYHHIAADYTEAAAKALNAGVDMELSDKPTYSNVPEALSKNLTEMEAIDKAVLHVLDLKFRLGLFENPYIEENKTALIGSQHHRDLSLKAARQSMVLLKNDDQLLPLDKNKYKKIAIIGPHANECILGGYSHLPRTKISPLEAIKEKYKDVEIIYAEGCKLNASKTTIGSTKLASHSSNLERIREAVTAAKSADVVVLMVGGNDLISKEATSKFTPGDLANLELIGDQNELIDSLKTLNKPMVAFVFSGPPISFVHLQKSVHAIVQCWYLGQETGYAVAETLFGDNNPSGKLSVSIPRSSGHLPDYYYAKPSARARGYNLEDISPLYPFGFGLSYTEFEYSNLQISNPAITANENTTVTIDVKNTGKLAGDEIVQLYIRDKVSSITRPIKELKDFKRIALKAGETKTVSFTITPDKLKFYDINMKEIVEPGDFEIMVGPSSEKHYSVKLTVLPVKN
jgi:beta-glucosidase